MHPRYDLNSKRNDAALLRLDQVVPLSHKVCFVIDMKKLTYSAAYSFKVVTIKELEVRSMITVMEPSAPLQAFGM